MITVRIEFISEQDRKILITHLKEHYEIIEEGKIRPSRKTNSRKKLQYVEIMIKNKK